jgi:hypothetical protein
MIISHIFATRKKSISLALGQNIHKNKHKSNLIVKKTPKSKIFGTKTLLLSREIKR